MKSGAAALLDRLVEALVDHAYERAGLNPSEPVMPVTVARGVLKNEPGCVQLVAHEEMVNTGGGWLTTVDDKWQIWVEEGQTPVAIQFSIGHELGHLILRDAGIWFRLHRDTIGSPDEEEMADRFAEELLARVGYGGRRRHVRVRKWAEERARLKNYGSRKAMLPFLELGRRIVAKARTEDEAQP